MINSPYLRRPVSVRQVMAEVLLALLPSLAVYVWLFGIGVLVQVALALIGALLAEAAMLKTRGKPLALFLGDLSAVVTAALIGLAFPPIAPWWLVVSASALAIVVAKHLYGGLGQNPFNPAMIAYALMIVSFPALMSQWPGSGQLSAAHQLNLIFGGERILDAITSATPLDALRTALHSAVGTPVASILEGRAFGVLGGRGWEWISLAYLAGGLFLLARRIITWHIPAAFLATLALISAVAWFANPQVYAPPFFHIASGGALLGAFFILTDPVTGATTPRGKLLFGGGAALVTWIIRTWGAYPDGVAFATLLMNLCVPLIDMKTQPPVFGHKKI